MMWPFGWVELASPSIDDPNANNVSPGERNGVIPSNSFDPWSQATNAEQTTGSGSLVSHCLRPICIPLPWTYDDTGVDFPAGCVLAMCGTVGSRSAGLSFGFLRGSGGTGTHSVTTRKHLWPIRVLVIGLPLATTGTVTIGHKADYTSGVATTIDHTFSFDGANGSQQVFVLETAISAPSTFTGNPVFRFQDSWTGTAPTFCIVEYNPDPLRYAFVVPTSLPVGFTARDDADDNRGGYWGAVDRGHAAFLRLRAHALHPSNWRYNILSSLTLGSPVTQAKGLNALNSYYMGSPSLPVDPVVSSAGLTATDYPCVWIGDTLYSTNYVTRALGTEILKDAEVVLTESFNTAGAHTHTQLAPFGTYYGPGCRNIRVYLLADFTTSGVRSCTIDDITTKTYVDGVLSDTNVYTGPYTLGSHFDIVDILPSATAEAKIEVKFEVHVTMGVAGAGDSGAFSGNLSTRFSPRCDIPLPYTVVGPNNEVAPGGVITSLLGSPLYNGEATIHNAAGVTSCVFAMIHANSNVRGSFACTFLPPTTGVWRVTSTITSGVTLGEFEFRIGARGSAIGRANKRFWGHSPRLGATTSSTWALAAVTKVSTVIPPTGVSMVGKLTDSNWFFGTIALAPGSYRVTVPCAALSGLLLALSVDDPYVADHLAGPHRLYDGDSTATSITVDITVEVATTVYVRCGMWDPYYRSGGSVDSPMTGGATGTISWAPI